MLLSASTLNKWENRAKTVSAGKRKTQLYKSGYFGNFFTTSHSDICNSLFFFTQRLVLRDKSVLHFLTVLFSLAKRCSQACSAFGRICAEKKCAKSGSQNNTDHIYFSLARSCSFTIQALTNNSKMLQFFFSYSWKAIYTFTNLLLRMQI